MFAQNGRVIHSDDSKDCWIIDPGLPPEADEMARYITKNNLSLTMVILTHAHADHCAGLDNVRAAFPAAEVYLSREEHPFLTDAAKNLSAPFGCPYAVSADGVEDLVDGALLRLGGTEWQVLDTSGHSPGGRSIYCAVERTVIVGDALFAGSIGRTDFPYSDHRRLICNLTEKLLALPDDTRVLSGHGPDTTIGIERRTNPYIGM
ncbi:MAG: MBL fold metallo-hydrolase [Phycisphaerae bacterium]|nr:MBL fold metallo-hydrolase [Phycisphaerae bacterium]